MYCGIADWRCCDSFRWTAKGLRYTYACIHSPLPSRLPHNIEQSSRCYTVGPCWLSIWNTAMCTCPSHTPKLSLPLILTPATISSFSKSVSLQIPPKESISLELLRVDLHCFSSIRYSSQTNPPIPSSPNKDHMLPQIWQKKKPSLPTSLFFFRLSISFSNHSWWVTIWRPLISLVRSGHPLFWNLQWLPRASYSSSSLVWHSRPSSVCPA